MQNHKKVTGCANCPYIGNCDWPVGQAIVEYWLPEKHITLTELCMNLGFSNMVLIEKLIRYGQALPSDFLHELVEFLGLKTVSRAKFEDTTDPLTDYECKVLIREPWIQQTKGRQSQFWSYNL